MYCRSHDLKSVHFIYIAWNNFFFQLGRCFSPKPWAFWHGRHMYQLLRMQGSEITPFLLGRIKELTGGESLKANIALIKNNAAVGAQIASALAAS